MKPRGRLLHALVVALVMAALALPADRARAVETGAAGYPWADFDNDGFGDVALAAPGEAIGSKREAGAVHVLFGSGSGLTASGDEVWHQDTGLPGRAETGDGFGAALATGDFDVDGFDDLAVGSPGESIGAAELAGAITVLYGSANGLTPSGAQLLRQGTAGVGGKPEDGDGFGFALSSGDLNGDGVSDLAVGAPGEGVGRVADAGLVAVLYGAPVVGLSGANGDTITQESDGVPGGAETGDGFGFSLTTGDVDGDAVFDLAVGVPFEDIGNKVDAGAAYAMTGSPTGVDMDNTDFLSQDHIFTTKKAATGDGFGFALAMGDIDPNETAPSFYDDLVIGVPGDLSDGGGSINVLSGSDNGLVAPGELWYQGATGDAGAIAGTREAGDSFGFALAVNDFGGSDAADVAVGVPGEDIGSLSEAGGVNVIYSNGSELDPTQGPNQFWSQNSSKVGGGAESGDIFGARLSSADFNNAKGDDLVIGAPGENVGSTRDAGTATVLYGTGTRLSGSGSDSWNQNSPGIGGGAERNDVFAGAAG